MRYLSVLLLLLWASIAAAQPPSAPGTPSIPADSANRKTLTVTVTGSGTVAGPGLSSCSSTGGDCTENIVVNTTTTIFATPATGSTFTGWSGDCSGTGVCTVTMSAAKNVVATFATTSPTLTVTKIGSGNGTVTSGGGSINCGSTCSASFGLGASLTLTAAADPGSSFLGWTGDCSGTGTCVLTMTENKNVTAEFSGTVVVFNRYARPNGLQVGNCTNNGTGTDGACRLDRALTLLQAGERLGLLDGTYQGAGNMLDFTAGSLPSKSGTAAARYTVQAVNDGQVFIDGQFARATFTLQGNSYWSFIGFDVGNSGGSSVVTVGGTLFGGFNPTTNLVFQRICAFNAGPLIWTTVDTLNNHHVWEVAQTSNSLFEDICGFGTGRDVLVEGGYTDNTYATGNVFRRAWMRWEGWVATVSGRCGAPGIQSGYGTKGTSTFENVIEIYDGQQMTNQTFWGVCYQGIGNPPSVDMYNHSNNDVRASYRRDEPQAGFGDRWRGGILYGYGSHPSGSPQPLTYGWKHFKSNPGFGDDSIVDFFIDGRSQSVPPLLIGCNAPCADRMTLIKDPTVQAGYPTIYTNSNNDSLPLANPSRYTNINECTTLGTCPNFYTGTGPGTGARNCFEYTNAVLGSTSTQRLWPWRMDNRIKAALARAQAAGTGGSPLAGVLGPGYAAGTVTSEIVSRYGAVPPECLR